MLVSSSLDNFEFRYFSEKWEPAFVDRGASFHVAEEIFVLLNVDAFKKFPFEIVLF